MSKAALEEGDLVESTAVDVIALEARIAALEKTLTPRMPGEVIAWAGTAPAALTGEQEVVSGWLLCNGASVGRTKWPQLFTALGTKFGAGDGSSTFGLPNLTGRLAVGKTTSGTFSAAIGVTGGAETVTLSINEIPSHSHAASQFNFALTQATAVLGQVGAGAYDLSGYSASTAAAGGGLAHANLQPYIIIEGYLVNAGVKAL